MEFSREITVAWGECDPFGLVYFPNMLMWFNDAEHAFWAAGGYPVNRMIAQDRSAFVMGRVQFEFKGPATHGDVLSIRIALKTLGNSTLTWDCSAERKSDGRLIVQGEATRIWACIQADGSLKSARIPDVFRQMLEAAAAATDAVRYRPDQP